MYWCSPLPARRLQPAEGYNPLSFCTSRSIYQYVGAYLQNASLLVFKLLVEGSYNPLALVLADMFTSTQVPAYDLPGTTFHTFSYWIHETITIVVQPASSISESPNTESLKPCQEHRQHNNNQIQLYLHTSHCIRYFNEPNMHVYALLPKTTRVQICKFKLKAPQLYQTSKHTQIITINMRQQIQSIHSQTI